MNEEKPLSELILKMMDSYQLSDKLIQTRVRNEWETIMGKTIARNTGKISIYQRTLFLEILSAPLKNDLYYHEKIVVEKVNQFASKSVIDKIKIK